MADIVDKATRSRMMSNIQGKDTKPELTVRRYLHGRGFRYSLKNRKLPGNPDIALPKHDAVIFVHGCFWHRHEGCRFAYSPKSRTEFWNSKFEKNVARDVTVREKLTNSGWRVATVWECCLRKSDERQRALDSLAEWILSGGSLIELPPAGGQAISS